MSIVLGIDPGSLVTGFGIVEQQTSELKYLESGCIRTKGKEIPERLQQIYQSVREIMKQYSPTEASIEQIFMHTNPGGALKLGQARGAAITAVVQDGIPIGEYSARQVKQAVVGTGAADKEQVQHMVKILLKLPETPQADAADALAIAICHINMRKNLQLIEQAEQFSRKRLQ